VVRAPRRILLLFVLVTVPLALHASPPSDNSFDIWFDSGDATYRSYLRYREQFESEEYILLAFQAGDVFTAECLEAVRRLARGLERVEGVDRVLCLTDAEDVQATGDGVVEVRPLVGERIPRDPAELRRIRRRALANPLYADNLVSRDGTVTAVYGVVNDRSMSLRRRMLEAVEDLARAETAASGLRIHVSGNPILDAEFDRISARDSMVFSLLTGVIIVLVLYALYRSVSGVVLPVLVVALATLWTLGLYGLLGYKLNMLSAMLPAVILAISVADAVHLMCQYNDEVLSGGLSRKEALVRTLGKVGRPCLFTSLTTAIGFGSFAVSRVAPVRLQGIFTAVGIVLAFALTVTLLPAMLSLIRSPRLSHRAVPGGDWVSRALERALRVVERFPVPILVISGLVLALGLGGVWRLKRETNAIDFLKKNSDMRVALEFIEENLTGVFTLEIVLRGPPGSMKDPEVLRRVESLRAFLQTQPEVRKTLHANDLIKEMNRVMHDGDPRRYRVPRTREEVAQYLLLYEMSGGEELEPLLSDDASSARISVRSRVMPAERGKALLEDLERELDARFPGPVRATVTGVVPVWVQLDTYLLQSQIRSFSIAAAGIFLMMCLLMGSVRVGLLSMLPNLLPIVATLGFMGWTGIRLDTATIMITSVALGIAVDDTIHFLARFRTELPRCGGDYDLASRQTLRSVGRAIVFTSIILFWGFITLTLGHFKPTVYFGFLTSLTMAVALLGDIFLLPVLLKVFRPFAADPAGRGPAPSR